MRMDPQSHVRLFVQNEREASSVLSFDSLASALTAMRATVFGMRAIYP